MEKLMKKIIWGVTYRMNFVKLKKEGHGGATYSA